jgi:hypothetical protein
VRGIIKGCIELRSIYTFVFTVVNDFDNMGVVWLLQFKVETRKLVGDIRMDNIQLNKALGIFKIIVLLVILLPFAIEEFNGLCLVFVLLVSSQIFNDFDDPVQHGKGGNHTGFFDDTHFDVENLVCALVIASGAKEYPREHARGHSVGNGWIIVGFDIESKGGLAVFFNQVHDQGQSCEGSICLIPQRPLGGYSAREEQSRQGG